MSPDGRSFIVTGGASGLGEATARGLVEAGANVVVADIDAERGEAVASDLGAAARFTQTDVTSDESVRGAVGVALDSFGGLQGAVSCAGIVIGERVLGRKGVHALDSFQRVVAVNLIGTFNVARLAAAAISRSDADEDGERGVIVNTASIAAFDGQIGQAAYAASKGGVAAMTLPLAREFAQTGIRVNTIAPGIFETPMFQSLSSEARDALGLQVPFPTRLGRPSEFAQLVLHAIENRMLNGEVIRLDGAIRMPAK